MWSYSKPTAYRIRKNGVHHSAYFLTRSKAVSLLRIGVPLFVVAATSALGWFSSSASKPATTMDVTHETSSSSNQEIEPPKTTTTNPDSINSIDASLEVTQSEVSAEPVVETKLNINSEPVVIPEEGTVHKVIKDENGTTTVDISVDSQTNGSSDKSTSMNVQVNSTSEVDSSIGTKEGP